MKKPSSEPLCQQADTENASWGAEPFEPVAIISMACRWPGGVSTTQELWELLNANKSASNEVPSHRMNIDALYHPNQMRPGSFVSPGAYFLDDDLRDFDPFFFGISPKEAADMDPQQRKLLEVCHALVHVFTLAEVKQLQVVYESFQEAGLTLEELSGSETGVYIASFTTDYAQQQYRDYDYAAPYAITGGGMTLLSNRISYAFNLRGPSMAIDTACSSSLYAIHLACKSLAAGDCTKAVVGGVNLIMAVEQQMGTARLGALSPTGKCHSFDEAADGYARGEGVGVLLLKKLSDALRDGDKIQAIIRGSAINANGQSEGITHPSADAQEAVIRKAYSSARISNFNDTDYVECHGTGTAVGDPTEVRALSQVFQDGRERDRPLLLGSIKPSIGHSEPASGIASIMKVIGAMQSGKIPATVGVTKLTPKINFEEWKVRVVTENTPWTQEKPFKRASVNSFGYGGANSHLVLEHNANCETVSLANGWHHEKPTHYVVPLSAHDDLSLQKNISALRRAVDQYRLRDVAYTLSTRRTQFPVRGFALTGFSSSSHWLEGANIVLGTARTKKNNGYRPVFIFSGQGAQWARMGVELLEIFPKFSQVLKALDATLSKLPDPPSWRFEEVLTMDESTTTINDPEFSQPICTAIQLALVDLMWSWNIRPSATIGHSSGEIAAAYASGRITREEAIVIAYYRGCSAASKAGAMLAVGMGASEVKSVLNDGKIPLTIACHNSPKSCTLSGDLEDIHRASASLDGHGTFNRMLKTGGRAYHSSHMKPFGPIYKEKLQAFYQSCLGLENNKLSLVPMISSVTATYAPPSLSPDYWRTNLESPVLFHEAVELLFKTSQHQNISTEAFIEIGPHPVLTGATRDISENLEVSKPDILPTLVRKQDATLSMLTLCGQLFLRGAPLDFSQINRVEEGKLVTGLPRYQFNYGTKYWAEPRANKERRLAKFPRHDLLGSKVLGATLTEPLYRNVLRLQDVPWIADHKIQGSILFPGAGYVMMVVEGLRQHWQERHGKNPNCVTLLNCTVQAPLVVKDGENHGIETFLHLVPRTLTNRASSPHAFDFRLSSIQGADSTLHVVGTVSTEDVHDTAPKKSFDVLPAPTNTDWYKAFDNAGYNYGPCFRGLKDLRLKAPHTQAFARTNTSLPEGIMRGPESHYMIHPVVIDQCVQAAILAAHNGDERTFTKCYVPVDIRRITVFQPRGEIESTAEVHAWGARLSQRSIDLSGDVVTADGTLLLRVEGIRAVALPTVETNASPAIPSNPYTRCVWKPDITFPDAETMILPQAPVGRSYSEDRANEIEKLAEIYAYQMREAVARLSPKDISAPHLKNYHSWLTKKMQRTQLCTKNQKSTAEETPMLTGIPRVDELCEMHRDVLGIITSKTPQKASSGFRPLDDITKDTHEFHSSYEALLKYVDVLVHKNPAINILEVGGLHSATGTASLLKHLDGLTRFARYRSYTYTHRDAHSLEQYSSIFKQFQKTDFRLLDLDQEPSGQGFRLGSYDLIIAVNSLNRHSSLRSSLQNAQSLLSQDGCLLLVEQIQDTVSSTLLHGISSNFWAGRAESRLWSPFVDEATWHSLLQDSGLEHAKTVYRQADYPAAILLGKKNSPEHTASSKNGNIVHLIYRHKISPVGAELAKILKTSGIAVKEVAIHQISAQTTSRDLNVIVLTDLEQGPLLCDITDAEWLALQGLVQISSSIKWVTGGSLIKGADATHALAGGMLQSVARENLATRFRTLDLGPELYREDALRGARFVSNWFMAQHNEPEVCVHDGLLCVPRYVPDQLLSEQYTHTVNGVAEKQFIDPDLCYEMKPGFAHHHDSIVFDKKKRPVSLLPDHIEVEVKAIGLNVKDLAIFSGKFEAGYMSCECAGVVRRIGSSVRTLKEGDMVMGLSLAKYENYHYLPETQCCKVERPSTFIELATMPVVFCAAIHALLNLGRLEKGESVLIHSAAGGFGIALLQVAKLQGATIYATVSSPEKKNFLVTQFGIPESHIFNSRDKSFRNGVMQQTDNHGIDVIVSSASGELLHESMSCLAYFGRMVDVARVDVIDFGKMELANFQRNASFSSFDLADIVERNPRLTSRLVRQFGELYNSGEIKPIKPTTVFALAELRKAYREFGRPGRMGKIVVDYESAGQIMVLPQLTVPSFDGEATYLMVGCLGGLGRSISWWMVDHGARNFIFISRSGATSPSAEGFSRDMASRGVSIDVIRGDVTSLRDVEAAVASAKSPVKGVVNAAADFQDAPFITMTPTQFRKALAPKVRGTLNLHQALSATEKQRPLDFFVVTSSVVATLGNAMQSNYSAANRFLDTFARYRMNEGLRCTSLGIGRVGSIGYAAENATVEAALEKSGHYKIEENELLANFAEAIRTSQAPLAGSDQQFDPWSTAHIITGLDVSRLTSGSVVLDSVGNDPRVSFLGLNIQDSAHQDAEKSAPIEVSVSRIIQLVSGKLSQLTGLEEEKFGANDELDALGLDSMMTTDLRNWIFKTFEVDMKHLEIMQGRTVTEISTIIFSRLAERNSG